MVVALFFVASAMVAGGLWAAITGWDLVVLERGWTLVISGIVLTTGGLLMFGIAAAVSALRRIAQSLRDGISVSSLAAVPSGPRFNEMPEVARPGPPPFSSDKDVFRPDGDTHARAASTAGAAAVAGALSGMNLGPARIEPETRERAEAPDDFTRAEIERPDEGEPSPASSAPRGEERAEEADLAVQNPVPAAGVDEAADIFGPERPPAAVPDRDDEAEPTSRVVREEEPAYALRPTFGEVAGSPTSIRADEAQGEPEETREEEPQYEASEEALPEPGPEPEPEPEIQVVGTYASGGNHYTMYSNGSIEAETPTGRYTFGSLDELKGFIASGGEDPSGATVKEPV